MPGDIRPATETRSLRRNYRRRFSPDACARYVGGAAGIRAARISSPRARRTLAGDHAEAICRDRAVVPLRCRLKLTWGPILPTYTDMLGRRPSPILRSARSM